MEYGKISRLPVTYIDSGDIIVASETDEDVTPKEECYTSAFNCNNVRANIYVDPANDNTIIINCNDYFLTFSQENK